MTQNFSRQSLLNRDLPEGSTFATLAKKIESRQAIISIIGLGYVGLPLAVVFAEAGYSVIGIDVDSQRVDSINRGESFTGDIPSKTLSRLTSNRARAADGGTPSTNGQSAGGLMATTDFDALADADVAIVCVPTPLSKTKDPDVSYIVSSADAIASRLHPGMLIVLESTTYPGTTEEIILPRLESADFRLNEGKQSCTFKVGTDFFLAFSPERIDPGGTD